MIIPYTTEKTPNGEKIKDIYSRLLEDRIVFVTGEVNDDMANTIVAELLFLDSKNHDDITLYINSPGGSVTAGMAIIDTMNFIKSDVSTVCTGLAASMGAMILTCGEKNKRYALPHSEIMIHQPLGGYQGQTTDMEIHTKRIIQTKKMINELLAEKTGKPLKTIKRDTERDKFLMANEAKEYGLIDNVIGEKHE